MNAAPKYFAVVGLAAIAACSDTPASLVPPGPTGPGTATQIQSGDPRYDLDEEWAQAARTSAPGFAGIHRDENGEYVVGVTRAELGQLAVTYARSRLEARRVANAVVRTRVVRWGFDQLKPWKDALTPLIDNEDVFWLDIDERQNMLIFGVRSASVRARLVRSAESLGVPVQAVDVVETEKPVQRVSLRDRVRPTSGGLQIAFGAGDSICSLGFNAYRSGVNGLVTASHCSKTMFGLDNGILYQSTWNNPDHNIAYETVDPSGSRTSDASFFSYQVGSHAADDWGNLTRTTSVGVNQAGSLTIDATYPKFRVTSEGSNAVQLVGETVHKVGRTSGWTKGPVTRTCISLGGLPCQWEASVWSQGGDSGSPMFQQNGTSEPDASRASLWGVLWGGPGLNFFVTYYSTIANVEQDLGALTTICDPSLSACKPTVVVTGPTLVRPYQTCTYTAVWSGGNLPYTNLTWHIDGAQWQDPSNTLVLLMDYQPFVGRWGHDAIGQFTAHSLNISYDDNAPNDPRCTG